ncbi:MFS general substrate transporter [Thozetella sp. PMI_491]|nr:MFS general substrate transporter [Thozetella sp. PMI_491]
MADKNHEKMLETVPGTELLIDEHPSQGKGNIQYASGGDGRIILIPQPSLNDPNDPLRWSPAKKWIVFIHGLAYSFLGSIIGPIMSGGMVQQAEFYGISISQLSWAAGIYLLASGLSTIIMMPLSVKYGRRPALLLSALAMGFGCVWLGVAAKTTFASFFAARAFAGLFAGPVEALVPSTVTDMFFLHNRGEKISLYGLCLLAGYEIGPVMSAFIIQDLGMNWAFFIVAFALFGNFLTMLFFMPETAYYGPRPSITSTSGSSRSISIEDKILPVTYIQSLKLWSKVSSNPNVSLRKVFLRPFVLCAYPTVLWACLVYGMALTWNIVLALTIAQLFAPPPYAFSSSEQGLVFLSPFVGSLVGTYLCGPLGDKIALYYTRRNNGIMEPEMRLPVAGLAALLTFVGVCIAGPCYHYQTHWIGPIAGFCVLSIGAQIGCNLSMTYALDCHKELAGELMITVSVVKSVFAWAWTWFINDWIVLNGMMAVYFIGKSNRLNANAGSG